MPYLLLVDKLLFYSHYQTAPGPCSHGYDLIPMALAGLLYAIYLSECWHYRTLLGIIPRMGASQAKDLASAMRDAVPIVWWKSTSYHYLRRTRRDLTKELDGLEDFAVVRMRFTKGFLFATVEAANEFEEQRTRFFTENEMLDEYMEASNCISNIGNILKL
uniref:Bestrophin homolog n=1 Tax=Meloidogyne javanica TaxID=6303 RepID=A0A915MHT9_MELJA